MFVCRVHFCRKIQQCPGITGYNLFSQVLIVLIGDTQVLYCEVGICGVYGEVKMDLSYTLSRDFRMARNQYLRLLCTREHLRQFARTRTIDEYDVTMPVSRVCMTSQNKLW